jgi:hypothetical protein
MPTFLEKLSLNELSLVDKGANQHASVTIFKRDASSGADKGGSSADSTAETKDDPNMAATEAQVADLNKSVEALTKSLDDTKAELAKAEAISKMSDAAKTYMKSLDDDAKAKFMSLSTAEQDAKAAKVAKADETLELHGQRIQKSAVGDGVFAVMKAQAAEIQKANERIEKAENEAKLQVLAKRADDEFASLPGDRLAKARILKSFETLSDEDRAAAEAMLKAGSSSLAKAFSTVGKNGSPAQAEGSAESQLQKKAEEIAKRDNVSVAKAYETAITENPDLYESIETPKA